MNIVILPHTKQINICQSTSYKTILTMLHFIYIIKYVFHPIQIDKILTNLEKYKSINFNTENVWLKQNLQLPGLLCKLNTTSFCFLLLFHFSVSASLSLFYLMLYFPWSLKMYQIKMLKLRLYISFFTEKILWIT